MKEKDEYWLCVIGPAKRSELPDGSDYPMRMAAKDAFVGITGREPDLCSSGWGLTEERKERVIKASFS